MMKSIPWFVLAALWLLVSSGSADARAVRMWSDQELLDKSALVVVGTPISSKDTPEHTKLGGDTVVGVETQFAVSKVFKGDPSVKRVTLHHYRFDQGAMSINGATLIAFDPKDKAPYRLFLVREADGRYAPAAGQMDAEISVHTEPVLEFTIEATRNRIKASEGLSFVITFHNHCAEKPAFDDSAKDLLLNGGELLGNGAQIWSSVEAELKNAAGERIPMALNWGVPGVAGRIYFLGVPLRAGSSYQLAVRARDCMIGADDILKPGKYEIRCVYHGRQSPDRDATQMPACWEGEVWSNVLKFEVVAE